jgi:NitT/TauT family transport system substrate-binding protein
MKTAARISACLVLLALVLPPAPAAAQEKVKASIGYYPVTGHAKFFVAKEQGFFEQENLDIELIEFQNSADGLAALRSGKVDVGAFGTIAPLLHISKDADIRIIGGVMGEDSYLVVKPETAGEIKAIGDLRGRKVATVRLASGDGIFRGALYQAGLSWKNKDVELFELKNPPAVIEAVKSGAVDAGVVWGPYDLQAEVLGLKVVINSSDLFPGHPCCRLAITGENADGRPEVWPRLLRAVLKAERFARGGGHTAETVESISHYANLDKKLIEKGYYHGHLDQSTDPNVEGVKKVWDLLREAEFIDSEADISRFVETKFYKQALDSLIAEEPGDPYWAGALAVYNQRDPGKVGGGLSSAAK